MPEDLRKDLSKASAEDIARMLGSKAPVIPPAAPAASKNGGHLASTPGGNIDLETFIDQKLRPLARQKAMKFDALLNGSCKAVSYEGGVLTLGFFMDAHHKKTVEQAQTRKVYEELATQIFGEPVTIQCILAEKTPKAIKSPLVQHAVQAHGAKIVSGDEEP